MQKSFDVRGCKLIRRSYRREPQSTAYIKRRTLHALNSTELSSEITSAMIMHRFSHVSDLILVIKTTILYNQAQFENAKHVVKFRPEERRLLLCYNGET